MFCQRGFGEDKRGEDVRERGSLGGQAQAAALAPARLTWGVAKKLEEERKWRSKDTTKLRRQDFKL